MGQTERSEGSLFDSLKPSGVHQISVTDMDRRIRVYALSKHPLVVRYVRETLRRDPQIAVICKPENKELKIERGEAPSVLLVDLVSLNRPFEGYIYTLRSSFPQSQILLLGTPDSEEEMCRLLLLGAKGFVPYASMEARLPAALARACEGRFVVSRKALAKFAEYCYQPSIRNPATKRVFSPHEKQLLSLLQRRLSNKEMAASLHITERTVKFHLAKIFAKLGVHDRYSAADAIEPRDFLDHAATANG